MGAADEIDDLDADELEVVQTGSSGTPQEAKKLAPPTRPPPRTRPTSPPPKPTVGTRPPSANGSVASAATPGAPRPQPRPSTPPIANKVPPTPAGAKSPTATPRPQPALKPPPPRATMPYEHPETKVELNIAPSESMTAAAERPLATQPGSASMQVQRAQTTVTDVTAFLKSVRARGKASDKPVIARLLVEQALAFERAGDQPAAAKTFSEALDIGGALLPAARGARRVSREAPLHTRLALLDKEAAITTKETDRADLHVERARLLEAEKKDDHDGIIKAYQSALALCPQHAEALQGLEAALVRARAKVQGDAAKNYDEQLADHCARLASAYGSDPELVGTYLATRARILEERGDAIGAEEAWASSLNADGRVGPVRESYKRHLTRRKAWSKLRDGIERPLLQFAIRLVHHAPPPLDRRSRPVIGCAQR